MTDEGEEWIMAVSCKVIMNSVCDAILKESKCDPKKDQAGKVSVQNWEILKPLYFCSFPAVLYIQNTT